MHESFWSLAFGPWTLLLTSAAAIAGLLLCLRSTRGETRTRGIRRLESLRFLIILLLLLTFFRPERVRREQRTDPPHIAVLADQSFSMRTPDVRDTPNTLATRHDWVTSRLATQQWTRITKGGVTLSFNPFSPTPALDADGLPPLEHGTDINQALLDAASAHGHLKAVVLFSDGDATLGDPPATAATLLRTRGIPVFTVLTGEERHLPDLILESLPAPSYALVDEQVVIPFSVRSHFDRELRTSIRITGDDGTDVSRDLRLAPYAQLQDALVFTPRREGDAHYTVTLPAEPDEAQTDNNQRRFRMALRREVLKVLVIDSVPRWEYRYLRNALARDPGVEVRSLLYHPGFTAESGGTDVARFPATREELSVFDVVFLGDVGIGAGELPEQAPELLAGLVRRQGSGLVFLPGQRARHQTFAGTALEELMPVERDPDRTGGLGAPIESRLALTLRGREHLLTMLAPDPEANAAIWHNLPGFFWFDGALRAKPTSTVLAVHDTARNRQGRIPLLVADTRGSGKVLYMGTDSAWRWRRGVEDRHHYRFWGQVVRWMAHQRHMAHQEGIRFFLHPENPNAGERVFLHATVFDAAGFPLERGSATVTIRSPSGRVEQAPLEAAGEGWGVFTGAFTPREGGEFNLRLESPEAGRALDTRLLVRAPRREPFGQPARPGTLREIAQITGGKAFLYTQLDTLLETLEVLPAPAPRETRLRLWCHPLWVAGITGLLTLYWIARKLMGLL